MQTCQVKGSPVVKWLVERRASLSVSWSASQKRGQLLLWVKNEKNLLFFCRDFSRLSALFWGFLNWFIWIHSDSLLFFSWIFIELKLITVFMNSIWCKGSEVRDYLVNISALVQTLGAAAGLRTTRNNDKKSCWLLRHYISFNIVHF